MALITCPNCGKQVSDTNGKCFHCGYDFTTQNEKPQKLPEYNKFTLAEQEKLRNEFYNKNPIYNSFTLKYNKLSKIINLTYALTLLTFVSIIIFSIIVKIIKFDFTEWMAIVLIIVLAVWFISVTSNIVLRKVVYKKYRHKELIIEKNFQKWLKDEKQLNYTVPFTAKQKKDKAFFDSIDANKDDIEV